MLNSTAIASGYAGRDPQGGTSDGSLLSKLSLFFIYFVIYNGIYNKKCGIYNEKCERKSWKMKCW